MGRTYSFAALVIVLPDVVDAVEGDVVKEDGAMARGSGSEVGQVDARSGTLGVCRCGYSLRTERESDQYFLIRREAVLPRLLAPDRQVAGKGRPL